ncbi:hypothetical protein L917_04289 [Phytophthora nicotianae]|uniref:Uncharacterized protein n=1 Tax=Phytophthora nicotianae TaxID=4792 RepID=W2LMI8_PHYNI|nr:hypothetical protein L917_04289 [Phytophthora nicotianae]
MWDGVVKCYQLLGKPMHAEKPAALMVAPPSLQPNKDALPQPEAVSVRIIVVAQRKAMLQFTCNYSLPLLLGTYMLSLDSLS